MKRNYTVKATAEYTVEAESEIEAFELVDSIIHEELKHQFSYETVCPLTIAERFQAVKMICEGADEEKKQNMKDMLDYSDARYDTEFNKKEDRPNIWNFICGYLRFLLN